MKKIFLLLMFLTVQNTYAIDVYFGKGKELVEKSIEECVQKNIERGSSKSESKIYCGCKMMNTYRPALWKDVNEYVETGYNDFFERRFREVDDNCIEAAEKKTFKKNEKLFLFANPGSWGRDM